MNSIKKQITELTCHLLRQEGLKAIQTNQQEGPS